MSEMKRTTLELWPELKEDLESFLSNTDTWMISELKTAYQAKDWKATIKLIGVMESVHNLNHPQ